MDIKTDTKTDRSNSVSSMSSAGSPPTRRGSGPMFANLHENKRGNDPRLTARRASLNEQRPTPGFFGSMWHNWTRGPAPTK